MAKFKDLLTGEVFEFTDEKDINALRKNSPYVEIEEEVKEILRYVEKEEPKPKKPTKK